VRIVHAIRTTRLSHGGPARSVVDMVGAMHGRGHDARLITVDRSGAPEAWGAPGKPDVFTVRAWPNERGFLTPDGLRTARQALAGADFLHLHEVWEVFNVQLARLARSLGVPYCLSPRGSLDDWGFGRKRIRKRLFHTLLSRRMMERAAFVHCTADGERAQSEVWYPRGRSVIIPNLLDMSPYADLPGPELALHSFGLPGDRPILLYMSRICAGKGLEFIVRAMPAILRSRPTTLLVIAGSGDPNWEAAVRAEAEDLGVSPSVRFIGFVGGREKASLLQTATLFLLPSSHENFGNVLFEAAACGAPLLVTRHVATWRELNAAGVARVVAQTPEEIAEAALDELALDPAEWAAKSRHVRDWTLTYFAGDRIAGMYESAYSSCIGERA
jgi:glycosyltransferase involved in cell wall biosynthesis